MAIKIKLEKDGFIKDGFVGYSFTSALLDFWVPAFRLDFSAFVFFFGIYMLEKEGTWLLYLFNAGVPIFSFFIALFIAFFYNKYYTKKMLKEGWKPLENDEYSNAILKGYHYLDYTDVEIRDEDKMQRYRSFINKTKSEEIKKIFGFIVLLIILCTLFYFDIL